MNNKALERVQEFLLPDHFADPANGQIYESMLAIAATGAPANPVTLKNVVEHKELVVNAGGMKYIASLLSGAVTTINAGDYGRLIYDLHMRRELIAVGEDLVNDAYSHNLDTSATEIADTAEERIHAMGQANVKESRLVPFQVAMKEATDRIHHIRHHGTKPGHMTGLRTLDAITGGFHPGNVVVLAGRPSMGKTALALGWMIDMAKEEAARAATDGSKARHGLFFSGEMTRDELAERGACHETGVSVTKTRNGNLDMLEYEDLLKAEKDLGALPMDIDDSPGLTTAMIRSRARRIQRKHGLLFIAVDYLQLIKPTKDQSRRDNRAQEVALMCHAFKDIAKELGVPVLLLAQLSRKVEERHDKRPQLADLRESGDIEQDADLVMFVYRHAYYHQRSKPDRANFDSQEHFEIKEHEWSVVAEAIREDAHVIVAKNRHGPIGTAKARFEESCVRFSNPLGANK